MPDDNVLESRKAQFLVAKPRTRPDQPLNFTLLGQLNPALQQTVVDGEVELSKVATVLQEELGQALKVDVLETIGPEDEATLLVIAMPSDRAKSLADAYQGHLRVEVNEPLDMLATNEPELALASEWYSGLVPLEEEFIVDLTVVEEEPKDEEEPEDEEEPAPVVAVAVAGATVYLLGSIWFAKGITDTHGHVKLTLYGETTDTLRALFIKPQANYWNFWNDRPDLQPQPANATVKLKKLGGANVLPNFPEQEQYGWGQKAMELDKAAQATGQGVKVAIIDSGLATDHQDLQALNVNANSRDFTNDEANPSDWKNDIVGHGSHVAGVIAGDRNGIGIGGFAPKAELLIFKVFPGGKFSDLIKSLNQCVTNAVHIVNLSLGSTNKSQIVEDAIAEARDAGVACIAAAGNSAGPVLYPAAFETVLAVSAIGKLGTFPENSHHAKQVHEDPNNSVENYFAGKFTCFGPEIDVCAPGVAVVSTVSPTPEDYASWDGTSMACPHVVGLAALILEVKDDIRGLSGSARVSKLFEAINNSAQSLGMTNEYQGAGLPNAVKALGAGAGDGQPTDQLIQQLASLLEQSTSIVNKLASSPT